MEKKKKKKSHVPFRLNILFIVVFLLFSMLVLRLGVVQIVNGEVYQAEVEKTENITARLDAPRGKMFDRYGRLLVDNKPIFSVTYTGTTTTDSEKRYEIAKKLATYIEKDTKEVTERDKKDFYIFLNSASFDKDIYKEKLSAEERDKLDDKEQYQLVLERITDDELNFSSDELEVLAIKRELDQAYALTPHRVKKGVTTQEIAVISEHLDEFNGMIDIKADAERTYPHGETLTSIFGNIGEIQREDLDSYKARGYENNDLVGTSFLEAQYEEFLRGKKKKVKYVTDKAGNPIGKPVQIPGERGKDLVLTIDLELQKAVEQIVAEELKKAKPGNPHLENAYVVMMNPQNGEILSIVGKGLKNGEVQDVPYGAIYNAYAMGSSVKAATVLTGFQTGAIHPGDKLVDETLYIQGSEAMSSWTHMGKINDLTALERSSNSYMWKTVIQIAGGRYVPHDRLRGVNTTKTIDILRDSFAQFGLGVKTNVDLPAEGTGYPGEDPNFANVMYFGIGQYDSYTPLQLAQYISTIANDGYRLQPRFVKEIHEPGQNNELGPLLKDFQPNVLNRIDMKDEYIERVQDGLYLVFNGSRGTAKSVAPGYEVAGKTGTAEVEYPYVTDNVVLVGYAPFDNPEMAFSIVVPFVSNGDHINNKIGSRIIKKYFELKESGHTKDMLNQSGNQVDQAKKEEQED